MRIQADNEGFTIIEILLAVAMGAMVLSTLYWAYTAVVGSTRNYGAVSDIYQTARIVLGNISKEISGAYQPFLVKDKILFECEDKWFRGGEADRLSVVTTTCLRGGEEELGYDAYEVSYYRGFGMKDGLLLMRRSPYFDPEEPFEGGAELILAENVRGLNFEYFDGEEWLEYWDAEEQEKLPRAVRITIALGTDDEKSPRRFSTVAYLPLAALLEEEEEEEESS